MPPALTSPLAWLGHTLRGLGLWLRANWALALAALSLAAAGVFLVQYGMERGLLSPALRVLAGLGLGALLVVAGEALRRRGRNRPDRPGVELAQALAGAGIVSVFVAIVAARQLYGLIGPETTFALLVLASLLALVLGWRHGALLAGLGLIGAAAAPALTGGGLAPPPGLYAHYGLVAALGLGIDTLRRWGWVSVLALVLAYGGGCLLLAAGADGTGLVLLAALLPILSLVLPARALVPDQGGPTLTEILASLGRRVPRFPMALAIGAMLASGVVLSILPLSAMASQLAFVILAGLVVFLLIWTDTNPRLHDLALIPALAFPGRLFVEWLRDGQLYLETHYFRFDGDPSQQGAPISPTLLMALAGAIALALALRVRRSTDHPVALGLGLALVPALAAGILGEFWSAALVLGSEFVWALHVVALAGLMVGLATMLARVEVEPPRRSTAYAVLSALVLIMLSLFVLTTDAAVTLALAVLVLSTALLDRRLDLPELGFAVIAGICIIAWRLTVDPGLIWTLCEDVSIWAVLLAYLGPIGAFLAAQQVLQGRHRPAAMAFLMSGASGTVALLADILLLRWLDGAMSSYLLFSTLALPWLLMALGQAYRLRLGGAMQPVRMVLGLAAGGFAGLGLVLSVLFNPVTFGDPVLGPLVLNSLFASYLLPGLCLLLPRRAMGHLPQILRRGLDLAGLAFVALYLGLQIRHFWRGPYLSVPGTTQPELYSYTIALLLLAAVLTWQALSLGSRPLWRLAMAGMGLTIAKVYLLDAAGLTGLTRVFSFLVLGLVLVGLAALNRVAQARTGPDRTRPL